jgi:ATP-dependent helicase/nuclease subunit B
MAGRIERVAPGPDSERALSAAIGQAKASDPLAPVTIVVPATTVALSLRQRLAELGPLAGVSFTDLPRLVEVHGATHVVEVAGEGVRAPLTEAAVLAAARVALAESPGLLQPVADHPATAASVVATYRSVRAAGDRDLDTLASTSALACDVVGLVKRMRSNLETSYYDRQDLTELARSGLEVGSAVEWARFADLGLIVVYLPAPLPEPYVRLLSAMAAQLFVIVLAGRCGDELADRGMDRFLGALLRSEAFELPAAGRVLAPGTAPVSAAAPGSAAVAPAPLFTSVVNAPDDDEEARSAVRLLIAHAEAGGHLGRCIITYPAGAASDGASGIAGRVCRQLDEAGIPWSGPCRRRLSEESPGQLLLDLVELSVPLERGQELDRGDVIQFLASGQIAAGRGLTRGLPSLVPGPGAQSGAGREGAESEEAAVLPISAWDRCSREAGVVSGIDEWQTRLGGLAERLRRQAAGAAAALPEQTGAAAPADRAAAPREQTGAAAPADRAAAPGEQPGAAAPTQGGEQSHRPTSADCAADLLEVVGRLWALIARAARCSTWKELTAWCVEALAEMLDPSPARDELEDAVADLGLLDAVEPLAGLDPPQRLEHFRQAVLAVLDKPGGGGGRFGTGPTVGPMSVIAGCRSELLLVLGCAEGALPARGRDDPLLPRYERQQIKVLAEPESEDERDRRTVATLLMASERAIALYSRVDAAAGRSRYRSRWLEHDLFGGTAVEVPSFAGALHEVSSGALPAASASDYELAVLSSEDQVAFDQALSDLDRDYGRRFRAARDRSGTAGLSRFAGYLGHPSEQLWREVHSATALENFATCPLRFFFSRLLHLRRLDPPERLDTIDARERGSLVHSVLERFFAPADERSGAVPVFDPEARQRLEMIAEEEFRRYQASGKTGKRVNWDVARDQILRDLRLFVEIEVGRAEAGHFVPQAVELCFGRQKAPPLVIEVAGREVKFSGQIDRVDRGPDGQVVVIDYKTGKADRFKDMAKDPLGRGGHLQLPLYAKAVADLPVPVAEWTPQEGPEEGPHGWRGEPGSSGARAARSAGAGSPPVRAEYRFASAVAGFSTVAVNLDEELDTQFREVLSTLVSTIDSGCFPPRPGELGWMNKYENCSFCDFNGVCTTDRAELWERASSDHRIKAYTDLVTDPESK